MHTKTRRDTSLRSSIGPAQLLAAGWVMVLALVYLVRFGNWLAPLQFVDLAAASNFAVGPHFGEFWLARLIDSGVVIAIIATAFAVGAVVTNRLTPEKNLVAAFFVLPVGFWVLAVTVLVIGAVSISQVPWAFGWAACWFFPAPRKFFHRRGASAERFDGWSTLMLGFLIAAAFLNLPGALAAPFEYDELEYHLGSLAEYIKAGHITLLPHNFYSNLPQLTEMLYLLGLVTHSDIAAKLLHWTFGLLVAGGVYIIATRLWSKRIGITAAALFYCMPFVQDLSETARIDLATTFFGLLAFGGLLLVSERGKETNNNFFWLSALATGAAIATKWTAVPVVMMPILAYLLTARLPPRRIAGYGFVAALVVLPWLVKNWLRTGDPVYPLLYGVFRPLHWSGAQSLLFAQKHYPNFDVTGWLEFVLLPWRYSIEDPIAAPLLLMTAPLILVVRNRSGATSRAGWLFVLGYAGWFLLTFRPWRFLLPACPLAALVGAYALENLEWARWFRTFSHIVAGVLLVTGLAIMGLNVLVDVENPGQMPPRMSLLSYALGGFSRDEFAGRMGKGVLEPVLWMNQNLPAGTKVLYVGEARAYYASNPLLWATAFDQHPLSEMSRAATSGAQLYEALRARGVSYIYINNSELARLGKNYGYLQDVNWQALKDALVNHATLIHQSGHNLVYKLNQ